MASHLYGAGALRVIIGNTETTTIDWINDTNIKCALSTSTHVPNKDDVFYDDAGADDLLDGELSGTGYTAGGDALGSQTLAYDAANDRVEFDAADGAWTGLDAGTIAQLTVLKDTGTPTTSPVFANIDNAAELPLVTNGSDVNAVWDAQGIAHLTV